jgi:hypothetical protein
MLRHLLHLVFVRKHDGLWTVVGGAFYAPSNELWETRNLRFP